MLCVLCIGSIDLFERWVRTYEQRVDSFDDLVSTFMHVSLDPPALMALTGRA
jgi:hypothetical protein